MTAEPGETLVISGNSASDGPVLRVAGVPAERGIAYAGLERLLRPLLPAGRPIDRLLTGDDEPDRRTYRVALAVLELLEPGTVLIAEEPRWLDEESREVLDLVARRLATVPARPVLADAIRAFDAGEAHVVREMLESVDRKRLNDREQLWLTWHESGAGGDIEVTNTRLLAAARTGAVDVLDEAVFQLFCTPLEPEVRATLTEFAQELGTGDARGASLLALAAPLEHGKEALAALPRHLTLAHADATEQHLLAWGALAVGAVAPARTLIAGAITRLRGQRRLGRMAQALTTEAWVGAFRADAHLVERAAAEAIALGDRTGQPQWANMARLARGMTAALRGEVAEADRIADAGVRATLGEGAHGTICLCQFVRGTAALGAGNGAAAFDHLRRMFDRGDIAFHPTVRFWAIGSLAEAAVLAGRTAEASTLLDELDGETACGSPALTRGLYVARVLLRLHSTPAGHAPDEVAKVLPAHPFDKARADFAYGVSLRRDRRNAEARPYLRAAASLFDAHGATAWSARARQELRATGESVRRPEREALTGQEAQIAELAAGGLTNKEIGQRLFLSPRTVSSHLYRIFPKLGITARSELPTALTDP